MRGVAAAALVVSMGYGATLGCGSLPQPPVRSVVGQVSAEGLAMDEPPALRLHPGDVVEVRLETGAGTTTQLSVVQADGRLFISNVGLVVAQDRSLEEVEARATRMLRSAQDRLGQVYLVLRDRAGHRVTVLGAVQRQGSVELVPGMRMADVVAAAGGPLTAAAPAGGAIPVPIADLGSAVVVRHGAPLPISIALALRGHPAHNVHAYPGDYLYVPMAEHRSVRVMGQVGSPLVFAPPERLRLTEALTRAGGITSGGDKSDVRLVRGPVDSPRVYSADLAAIVSGEGPDVEIAPGDFLFVTDDPVEDIGEVVSVIAPLAGLMATIAFTALLLEL